MKIQLDTTHKTIIIEEAVNLAELFDTLEKLLPNGLWKQFKLECKQIINWVNPQPIIIEKYPVNPLIPSYPPIGVPNPWIVCHDTTPINCSLQKGIFNLSVDIVHNPEPYQTSRD